MLGVKDFLYKIIKLQQLIFIAIAFIFVPLSNAANLPYSEWILTNYENAYATFNSGIVSVINGGNDFWNVQLVRKNIELQSGKNYQVKFFVQGISKRRLVEVRIARDGFPYDAFAEFGEIAATVNGRTITKNFTMHSGGVNNARFEFNIGKYGGTIFIDSVSLICLDCESDRDFFVNVNNQEFSEFAIVADSLNVADNAMILGNIFANDFRLGANSKVYGNANVKSCFLRERAFIKDTLMFENECTEQNGTFAAKKIKATLQKPAATISNFFAGIEQINVLNSNTILLLPGNYGSFYASANATVKFSNGTYNFQNLYTEPNTKFYFDLSLGTVQINVANNIHFGDRNNFEILNGNPSEIIFNVLGNAIDFGTDGLYFGKFIAPNSNVKLPSRSNLVGKIYAKKLTIEPQSTISQEVRATEIAHNHEHFGPFFSADNFRYKSALPIGTNKVTIYIFAEDANVTINGENAAKDTLLGAFVKNVDLKNANNTVKILVEKNQIFGFPKEAFYSEYKFDFSKSANYKLYWNPQSACKQGCDGATLETAISDFETALKLAQQSGKEMNMSGGTWDATKNFTNSVVTFEQGFEIVGYVGNIFDLNSENELPKIDLKHFAHIQVEGLAPRKFEGLHIVNGFNKKSGGAITSNANLELKNMIISDSKSETDGGAIFAAGNIKIKNARFANNVANKNGGAIFAKNNIEQDSLINVIFYNNSSKNNGGAIDSKSMYIANAIFVNNNSKNIGGAIFLDNAIWRSKLNLYNSTFFKNSAGKSFGAIGSLKENLNGNIENSIFWKNEILAKDSNSNTQEICDGFIVSNSSLTNAYADQNNFIGDPKFANENNLAGENFFMSYDAGINLAENSPLLNAGKMNQNVPTTDILGSERSGENIALGAYVWALSEKDAFIGKLNNEGSVTSAYPIIPLINELPGEWILNFVANSKLSRVIKASIKKHKKTKVSSAEIQVTLRDKNGKTYSDIPAVKFKVYRNGEEHGKYIFQSMTLTQGKPIIFSSKPSDVRVYDNVIVLCVKESTDYFHIKVTDY